MVLHYGSVKNAVSSHGAYAVVRPSDEIMVNVIVTVPTLDYKRVFQARVPDSNTEWRREIIETLLV